MNEPYGNEACSTAGDRAACALPASACAAGSAAGSASGNVQDYGINVVRRSECSASVVLNIFNEQLQIADDGYGIPGWIQDAACALRTVRGELHHR